MLPLLAASRRWLGALTLTVAVTTGALAQSWAPARIPRVPSRLDSLQRRLKHPGVPDTTRVKYLLLLSSFYLSGNYDSSRYYAQQAQLLARRRQFAWGEAQAWAYLGSVEYYASDYEAAQRALEQELRLGQRVHDLRAVGHAYMGLGNVAWELHNAEAFHAYYSQAQRAYAACTPRFAGGELMIAANRANNYLVKHQYAEAQAQLRLMPPLLRLQPNAGAAILYRTALGQVQLAHHQPDSARASWLLAVRQAHELEMIDLEAENQRHLAALALEQHQPAVALPHAREAARLARALADPATLAEALRAQAQAMAQLRQPGAYDTLNHYATLRDTLFNQERLQAVTDAQARFDRAGQQARIATLEKDRRIQALEAERRATRTTILATVGSVVALLLLGGIVLLYRRRQRRQDAALRQQLAADLHDDVGNLLTQISMQSSLLREKQHSPEQLVARLDRLATTARQAAQQMNDVIWGLGDESQTVGQLITRMRDHAYEMLAPTGIELDFQVDDSLLHAELPLAVRQNLYLIFKEALHNVVKHAQATRVRVAFSRAAGRVHLSVIDNGRGLTAPADRLGGNGLRNMRARAEAVGGQLEVQPQPQGFGVEVALPA